MLKQKKTAKKTHGHPLRRIAVGMGFSVVLFLVCIEAGSYAILRIRHEGVTIEELHEKRASLLAPREQREAEQQPGIDSSGTTPESNDRAAREEPPVFVEREALHPYMGYVTMPKEGYDFPVSEYGFQDTHSPIYRSRPGRIIVGIVGGSFAMQFAQLSAETLERFLKESPEFRETEFVFVNIALGGFKQPQPLMALNYLLAAGGEFDWIVNIDGFNEVALHRTENRKQGVSAIYPRSWYFRVGDIPDRPLRNLEGRVAYQRDRRMRLAKTFSTTVVERSFFNNLLWHTLDRRAEFAINEALITIQQYTPSEVAAILRGPPDNFLDDTAAYEELVEIWKRCSFQIDALCEGMGIRYFHFLQPNQYDPGSKILSAEEQRVAYAKNWRFRTDTERAYPILRRKGSDLLDMGVRFDDMSMIFAGLEDTLYNDMCCHLNKKGYDMIAEYIGAAILSHLNGIDRVDPEN